MFTEKHRFLTCILLTLFEFVDLGTQHLALQIRCMFIVCRVFFVDCVESCLDIVTLPECIQIILFDSVKLLVGGSEDNKSSYFMNNYGFITLRSNKQNIHLNACTHQ